ncbi:MAG: hypothetical protein ACK4L7_05745 [Flavobacteriales bacterium]
MQPLQPFDLVVPDGGAADGEVLSPESHVFVALMSVEEGPNKASFMPLHAAIAKCDEAGQCMLAAVPAP